MLNPMANFTNLSDILRRLLKGSSLSLWDVILNGISD